MSRNQITPYRLIFFLLTVINVVECYKILAIFPHPGKSHVDAFVPLLKALAQKGHHVTVISYFPTHSPQERYRDISLENTVDKLFLNALSVERTLERTRWAGYRLVESMLRFAVEFCEHGLTSAGVRDLVESNQTFDVMLAELFHTDCHLGLLDRYERTPLVGLSSCVLPAWVGPRLGNPEHPAYVPNLALDHTNHMGFLQRVENALVNLYHVWTHRRLIGGYDQGRGGLSHPPEHPRYAPEVLLVNTHYTLNFPRPLVPAVVEVAGMHVAKPSRLPQNLEKWIAESPEGVVYFSLGSVIKGHTFPEEKRRAFLRAFARLPQRVLWKWENDSMPDKPANVMIQKWMPQLDILCHPNVKAFVSHGGLLGTIEAVHCGVPAVVMPQFGDQFTNARALEANGGGLVLHLHEATEDSVYKTLRRVLRTDFKKQAEELSARFRDRPMSPLDTAVYWVEYVARHKGAPFMRTAAVGMPWYRYLLLDVVAFVLLVLVLLMVCAFLAIRAVWRMWRGAGARPAAAAATGPASARGGGKVKKN